MRNLCGFCTLAISLCMYTVSRLQRRSAMRMHATAGLEEQNSTSVSCCKHCSSNAVVCTETSSWCMAHRLKMDEIVYRVLHFDTRRLLGASDKFYFGFEMGTGGIVLTSVVLRVCVAVLVSKRMFSV